MKLSLWLSALNGLANASILKLQSSRECSGGTVSVDATKLFRSKIYNPRFFSLKIDDTNGEGEAPHKRPFVGYTIRLEDGIVVATPYSKWRDLELPILFVDENTQCYTVGRRPLQLYISIVSGALRYAPVGWLPPNSIALDFSRTGDNSLDLIDSSPTYFAWPSTEERTPNSSTGTWWLCPITGTDQYQVFIHDFKLGNRGRSGVAKDHCVRTSLAAINASANS